MWEEITVAASISESCFWMSKERGLSMQTKNKSDFPKNELWLCLQWINQVREYEKVTEFGMRIQEDYYDSSMLLTWMQELPKIVSQSETKCQPDLDIQ